MPDFPALSLKKYSLCRELSFEMPFKLNLGIWIVQIYLTLCISQNIFFFRPERFLLNLATFWQLDSVAGRMLWGLFLGTQSSLHFSCSRNIFSLFYVRLTAEFCSNTPPQDLNSDFIPLCTSCSFGGDCHQISWSEKKGQLYSESSWLFSCF